MRVLMDDFRPLLIPARTACLVIIGLICATWAFDTVAMETETCPQDLSREFPVDLNGDGDLEQVRMLDVPTTEGGDARIDVRDQDGRLLWLGPASGPLLFNCRPWGLYWPSVVGDIDHDGAIELLAQEPQSDVSPSRFFMARWDGQAFKPVENGWSLLETAPGSGRFAKSIYTYSEEPVTWIMNFQGLEADDTARVEIYSMDAEGGLRMGVAMVGMETQSGELRVLRWVQPLQR